ncbi:hypothetical protein RB195_007364 [Necator americanus]|uniref:t-SNARE coiled-coil homology domain-containing protein n=1 Tax=Necator americanus TaxID=51031 RepID=A0ABR1BWX0_NECAM
MENESREGAFQQLKDMISELRQYVGERCIELQEQLSKQDDVIESAVESLEILKKSVRDLTKEVVEQKQTVREEEEDYDTEKRRTHHLPMKPTALNHSGNSWRKTTS